MYRLVGGLRHQGRLWRPAILQVHALLVRWLNLPVKRSGDAGQNVQPNWMPKLMLSLLV